jgi:hypothetical protein
MIRTPAVFTLDPRRYHIERATIPQVTPDGITPPIEVTMDYALLAADLDVMGYPDEFVEAVQALDDDHKGSSILVEVADERQRQIGKGYDAAHDDQEEDLGVLVSALTMTAECRMMMTHATFMRLEHIRGRHPSRREQLIIAAALLVAEVERLDRIKPAPRQNVSLKPGDLVGGYAVMHDADGQPVRRSIIAPAE